MRTRRTDNCTNFAKVSLGRGLRVRLRVKLGPRPPAALGVGLPTPPTSPTAALGVGLPTPPEGLAGRSPAFAPNLANTKSVQARAGGG
jgi:hypothetical protein